MKLNRIKIDWWNWWASLQLALYLVVIGYFIYALNGFGEQIITVADTPIGQITLREISHLKNLIAALFIFTFLQTKGLELTLVVCILIIRLNYQRCLDRFPKTNSLNLT